MNCRYQRNIFYFFHKFQNNFSQIMVGPTSPTLSLPFRRLRTSLPFRRMRTQTESEEEVATVIRPGGSPPRWPLRSRPLALLIAGPPCSQPPAARPPWPGLRALRLAASAASPTLAACACLACSSAALLLAVRVRSDGLKIS